MRFMNGDKVLVRITEPKKWNATVRGMVQGKQGVIEKTSDKYRGLRSQGVLRYMVVFAEPIPPPLLDKHRGSITGFWFDPHEIEMVEAVPGERCEHEWQERVNHGDFNQLVSVVRTCTKCKKMQIARCDGGTYEPEWEDMKQ